MHSHASNSMDNHHSGGLFTRTSTATTGSTVSTTADMGGIKPRLSLPTKLGRDPSPGLQWHKEYTPETAKRPRCLMIDYLRKEAGGRSRKVLAEEIQDMASLRGCYSRGRKSSELDLRVFHIQNWPEATTYMIHKFRLHGDDELTGQSGFADWITQEQPQRRAGKPLLVARSWKVSSDPWRGVTKCAIGLDVMKQYPCADLENPIPELKKPTRVTGLMGFDENDNPVLHSNVFCQRTSVYVQYAQTEEQKTSVPDVVSPYRTPQSINRLDNGNVIIIFETSDSGSIYDTLITARGEWESRWRRLPFFIRNAQGGIQDEALMTGDCMRTITRDIFKAVAENWDELLDASWSHVSILEDKIYEHPADESRAPELWRTQAKWLIYEKLMFSHQDAINDMRGYLVELDDDLSDEGQWLKEAPADFQRLGTLIEEDLVKRTNNLSELMYKSVGIRDSRESLRLGASMWRLSWITFIFLPLTFLVSFFGMSVDTFANNPSIAWYFIAAVPFMIFVLLLWYLLKHWFAKSRQQTLQRGAYETLFTELQSMRPEIWTRQGPRDNIEVADRISYWKWTMIRRWTTGNAIPNATSVVGDEPIGQWNRLKRRLIKRWTGEIVVAHRSQADIEAGGQLIEEPPVEPMPTSRRYAVVIGGSSEEEDDVELVPVSGGNRGSGVLVEERSDGGQWAGVDEQAVVEAVDWAERIHGKRGVEEEVEEVLEEELEEMAVEEEGQR